MRSNAGLTSALCALTTNHTHFFRESHHLDHLRMHLQQPWLDRLDAGEQVRVWSAGCSSGEEAWSILQSIMGTKQANCERAERGNLRLLASDIDRNVLRVASAGHYPIDTLAGIPAELAKLWVVREGDGFSISPRLRNFACFQMLNLIGEWPLRQRFDAIFCRNVMIYFDGPTKQRLVERLAEMLLPGGILYIGQSERITKDALPELMEIGPTIYSKEER
ncbi:protein-glutamate O-methyltransferase CheR [Porphyrobacter algicida]|uniref:Protein-glutamate O-methyltransferase CheR n=1 Tax=Qipengyuania algicida TaxID=1836209 RepID=A0A845AFQ8_9SPHN|nr:protein-glutamate O-methyltransferase CheR [Qipengyuania algicida]MXP27635.1 protein-glutamate O-methyltransferase CheR [Qipengyuania algicida]